MSSQAKIVTRILGDKLEEFEADNIALKQTNVKKMGGQTGHRSEFTEWHDVPYVSSVIDGLTISNFEEVTAMAVPHRVSTYASVPFKLTNTDTLDESELSSKLKSAFQAIDNRINRAIVNNVVTQGSLFVGRTAALSGFADIAAIDTLYTEQDVSQTTDKTVLLNAGDYNAMAADLATRDRNKGAIGTSAYEKALVAEIAAMKVFKTSFTPNKAAAVLASTTVTGAQSYTPVGNSLDANGDPTNVDNRSMNLVVGSTTAVVAGDKFTIAAVNAVSIQNKESTGNLRTFTVVAVVDGTNLTISPPVIDATDTANTTAGQAKRDYGNCDAVAGAGATLTFVNYDAAKSNIFWENDAICVNVAPVVGSENDLGGMILMNETTPGGLNVVVAKEGSIADLSTNWRVTTFFGVTVRDPLKCGMLLGAQTP